MGVRGLVLAVLAAVSGGVLWWILSGYHLIDLQVYRFGVEAWLSGGDPYGPMPKTTLGVGLPYLYPPPSLVVFIPVAAVSLFASKVITTGLSVLAIAVTAYVVIGRCWPRATPAAIVGVIALTMPVALLLEPVRETLTFGQINLWLMALVAVDCLARKPRWPRGVLVGLAFAIKLTPIVFILFFLLRRDFRAAVVTVLSAVGWVVLGFLVAWKPSMDYWLSGAGPTSGVSGTPFGTNQTILAALRRIDEIPQSVQTGIWVGLVGVVVAVAVLLIVRVDAPTALVVNAALAVLISPTAWSHHWVFIVAALIVLARHATRHRLWAVLGVVVLGVFLAGPHLYLTRGSDTEFTWTWYQHIFGDSYVILALLAFAITLWQGRARKPSPDREKAVTAETV